MHAGVYKPKHYAVREWVGEWVLHSDPFSAWGGYVGQLINPVGLHFLVFVGFSVSPSVAT